MTESSVMGRHRVAPAPLVPVPLRALAVTGVVGAFALSDSGTALLSATDAEAVAQLATEPSALSAEPVFSQPVVVTPAPDPAKPKTVMVAEGATLVSLAQDSGMSWMDLWRRNLDAVPDPAVLRVGQQLSLDAEMRPAPPVPAKRPAAAVKAAPKPSPVPRTQVAKPVPRPSPTPRTVAKAAPERTVSVSQSVAPSSARLLAAIEKCESGGKNIPNSSGASTASGFYQITNGTWASVGGSGRAMNASRAEQTQRAAKLLARDGTAPWNPSRHCWGDDVAPVKAGVKLSASTGPLDEPEGSEQKAEPVPQARGVAAIPAIAKSFIGVPYRFGGKTRAGLDCSGFVFNVLRAAGITDTYRDSGSLRAWAKPIPKSAARAGDLVFGPGHVGIYLGDGMMIDSSRPGTTIKVRPVHSQITSYGRVQA